MMHSNKIRRSNKIRSNTLFSGLLVLITCFMSFTAGAQQADDCLSLFAEAFGNFSAPTGKRYAMTYSLYTTSVSDFDSKDSVEIRTDEEKVFVHTLNSTIYKDDASLVFIDDRQKLIFITKGGDELLNQATMDQFSAIRDSLLSKDIKLNCQELLSQHGISSTVISLGSDNKMVSDLDMSELRYWVDPKTKFIEKVEGIYQPGHAQLKHFVVSFHKYDKDFGGTVFEGTALQKVYKKQGVIHDEYSKYRLVNKLNNQQE